MQNLIKTLEMEHLDFLATLTKKPSDFGDRPTCSTGKNDTELYQDTLIINVLRVLNQGNQFKCAVLLGHPSGAKRQIARWVKLGYAEQNIVIFEWCTRVAKKLKTWMRRHDYKCTVICCDLIKGVKVLSQAGFKFNYIEFDGVERFGTQEPKLYDLASEWNIPVLVTQGSGRTQSDWFKKQAKELGAKKYKNSNTTIKSLGYRLTDTADKIIAKNLKGYDSHLITYGGRETIVRDGTVRKAPMYMAISIKAA
jgi:hypothetical protein